MTISLKQAGTGIYELEPRPDARVPARLIASPALLPSIREDQASLRQLQNVATLPGIVGAAWAMPDVHMGYGFPIGGVAATDADNGVISPGGVGYDINCGVRLTAFDLSEGEVRARLEGVADALAAATPCGVGRGGPVRVRGRDMDAVLQRGAAWAVDQGYGTPEDLACVEECGAIAGADPHAVEDRARGRGSSQLGTLGSGNHFLELGVVDSVFDAPVAAALGLREGQVTLILHTGSRGLGHQVCTDSLKHMKQAMRKYAIHVPDPQLCCVPVDSPEGRSYLGAMNAAVNFAFANRQILAATAARALGGALDKTLSQLGANTVYEVAHNIAKMETHTVDGVSRRLCVHRKGATRAFPPGHPEIPAAYREVGQPVLIPGDMERYSFVLVGRPEAMKRTFGSTCHGAGRRLSRTKARALSRGRPIARELARKGVLLRAASRRTEQEEVAEAYKDVAEVVEAVAQAGLSTVVARLKPLVVVKG